MSDTFIPVDQLEWKLTKINRYIQEGPLENHKYRFELELFEPLASWDALDLWEDERLASMQKHIKRDDVVLDVGVEQGWMSAIISKYMSDNLLLAEPTAEFWPGIKAIFERNDLEKPLACYVGFISDETKGNKYDSFYFPYEWPSEAHQNDVIEKRKYRNVFDKDDQKIIPSLALDEADAIGPVGVDKIDHITMDIEGAELKALKGMEKLLKKDQPMVWVSIHPDMLERDYGQSKEDVYFFMDSCGYDAELLAIDHENHVLFTPRKK